MQKNRRCCWAGNDELYCAYHDNEWGTPSHDDRHLFEMLILEGFQAGLSWITILKKRQAFTKAFDKWDYKKVARYDQHKIDELMANSDIIRNRLKIAAAIKNAQIFLTIQKEFGSFDTYVWQFVGGKPLVPKKRAASLKELPTHSKESDALSADLKQRGCSFVGSVICYSFMQAVGMVDDHLAGCFKSFI